MHVEISVYYDNAGKSEAILQMADGVCVIFHCVRDTDSKHRQPAYKSLKDTQGKGEQGAKREEQRLVSHKTYHR